MTDNFEKTYPNYPFAPLVKFGIVTAYYIAFLLRNNKAAQDISDFYPNSELDFGNAKSELQQLVAANKKAENANKAA